MARKNIEKDSIKRLVSIARKQLNAETFEDIDDFSGVDFWVSSGVPDLDWLMQTFGYNPGIMEVAGKSRSGKTTLLLHAIREILKVKGIPFIVSTERRENRDNALRMGIDVTSVLRKKVKTIEEAFDRIDEFIDLVRDEDEDIPILVGLDSLGATPTKAELQAKENQEFMAVAARVIKGRLRRITQVIDDKKAILYVNNQTYDKVGMVFGKKTQSYGGEGLKFHRQLGIEASKIRTLKIGERKIGQISRLEITKSDFTMPEQYVDIPLLWGYGYVPSKSLLAFGEEMEVLESIGKGYRIKKLPKIYWKSETEFYKLMMDDLKVRNLLNFLLTKAVHKEVKIQRGIK